jgi:hypothetical protein
MHLSDGSAKIRTFHFSAWIKRRGHRDDSEVPEGAMRDPDEWLEITGMVAPSRVIEFLEDAHLRGRAVYGVLIATRSDDS